MGTVVIRGGRYRAQVFRHGVRDSQTFDTRVEAQDWMVTREAEILRGQREPSRKTLREVAQKYMDTAEMSEPDKQRLARFLKHPVADVEIGKLTSEHLADWRDQRLKQVKGSTVKRERTVVRSMLEVARRTMKVIEANPMDDVRPPKKIPARRRVIGGAEIEAVLQALGYVEGVRVTTIMHEVAVAFLIALETAMRAGEITGLPWSAVDLKRKTVSLAKTKNGTSRDVPLSSRAVALFEAMAGKRLVRVRLPVEDKVFHVDMERLSSVFRRARKQAGLDGFTFHDSRRTATMRLAKKVPVLDLARITGHLNINELMTYYAPTADELAELL